MKPEFNCRNAVISLGILFWIIAAVAQIGIGYQPVFVEAGEITRSELMELVFQRYPADALTVLASAAFGLTLLFFGLVWE